MVSEELLFIERVGIGGAAFVMVYVLLRNMQEKVFEQSNRMINLAEGVIKENTIALQGMSDALTAHTKQKEPFIEEIKDCKRNRDEFLRRIEEKLG